MVRFAGVLLGVSINPDLSDGFDLEVSFLFPLSTENLLLNFIDFLGIFIFLIILTIGFIYEWKKGGLDW